jgi:serine/threonine protein kinase
LFKFYFLFFVDVISKLIKKGGYGEVYEGIEKITNIKKAIKVSPAYGKEGQSMKREINIGFLKNIKSNFNISYEDSFEVGENHFLVMPLMRSSLDDKIQELKKSQKLLTDNVILIFILFYFILFYFIIEGSNNNDVTNINRSMLMMYVILI